MRRCARVTVETSEPLWPSTRAAKMSRGTKQKTKKKKIERKVSQCVNLCKWVMCANCCPPTPSERTPETPEIPEKKSPKRAGGWTRKAATLVSFCLALSAAAPSFFIYHAKFMHCLTRPTCCPPDCLLARRERPFIIPGPTWCMRNTNALKSMWRFFVRRARKYATFFLGVSFFTDCTLIRKIVQCCVKWQTCCNLNIMIIYDLFADTIYMLFFYCCCFCCFWCWCLYCCVELIKYAFIIYI